MDQQQLEELVDRLSQRLDTVEAELKELRARSDADIPEDNPHGDLRCGLRVPGQPGQGERP